MLMDLYVDALVRDEGAPDQRHQMMTKWATVTRPATEPLPVGDCLVLGPIRCWKRAKRALNLKPFPHYCLKGNVCHSGDPAWLADNLVYFHRPVGARRRPFAGCLLADWY